ncbi:hypothetical protein GOBAR_DD21915 [Gossypium barbadense]|nr:hypothetical protein GOBAR_DD21915 [Gossypium barbadense]
MRDETRGGDMRIYYLLKEKDWNGKGELTGCPLVYKKKNENTGKAKAHERFIASATNSYHPLLQMLRFAAANYHPMSLYSHLRLVAPHERLPSEIFIFTSSKRLLPSNRTGVLYHPVRKPPSMRLGAGYSLLSTKFHFARANDSVTDRPLCEPFELLAEVRHIFYIWAPPGTLWALNGGEAYLLHSSPSANPLSFQWR